jgi:UrcA family protein
MKTIARNNRNFTLAAVAAVCLAAVTAGAHADEAANGVAARTVHYAAVNLNTQAGAAVLYKRIRNAAEQVCGDVGARDLTEAAAAKACVDQAIFASVRSVDNPKLTTEYNTRIGAAQPITMASVR